MIERFQIRRMNQREVADIAIAWAAKEGWNPGLHDAACFYTADPQGFFVGELDMEPIAVISAVAYDRQFGFLGFYIVKPEFRNQGYGMKIWQEALRYLAGRNIGGDGVLQRVKDYEAQGFRVYYKNRRYRAFGLGDLSSRDLVEAQDLDFAKLAAYDERIFSAERHKFLECWISQPQTKSYAFLEGARISGYGVLRPCYNGYKIGPLFADNSLIAEKILIALMGEVPPDKELFFDTPEANPQAVNLAQKYKMEVVFETVRIYSRSAPKVPLEKVYGVTSFELG